MRKIRFTHFRLCMASAVIKGSILRHQQWRLHEVAKGASTHLNRASSRRFLVAGSDPSRMGAQYMSKCAYIDCTFDEGDLCEYISAHAEDDVDLILGQFL